MTPATDLLSLGLVIAKGASPTDVVKRQTIAGTLVVRGIVGTILFAIKRISGSAI